MDDNIPFLFGWVRGMSQFFVWLEGQELDLMSLFFCLVRRMWINIGLWRPLWRCGEISPCYRNNSYVWMYSSSSTRIQFFLRGGGTWDGPMGVHPHLHSRDQCKQRVVALIQQRTKQLAAPKKWISLAPLNQMHPKKRVTGSFPCHAKKHCCMSIICPPKF